MRSGALQTDVLVIGAGVSGCCSALALRADGLDVVLVERLSGRPQRFCGEFVSGEAVDSLGRLGLLERISSVGPNRVERMGLYGLNGRSHRLTLRNEGLGVSRRTLDAAMLEEAKSRGVRTFEGTEVEQISGDSTAGFAVSLREVGGKQDLLVRSRAVIGAHGKRSSFDRLLGRDFVKKPSRFVGIKCHYRGADRGRDVELYLFPGGYCGAVGIEDGLTNICLLATREALERSGGRPRNVIEAARDANPFLSEWLSEAEIVEGSLMTISQVPFARKDQVVDGVFMVGDSAGLPAPFLGVGVAAGMRSSLACAELLTQWLRGSQDSQWAQRQYRAWWRRRFAAHCRWGWFASRQLCRPGVSGMAIRILNRFPRVGETLYLKSRSARANTGLGPSSPLGPNTHQGRC